MNIIKSIVVAAAVVFSMAMGASAADKVKVGFIYVGPIGDHGWTYRHDIGRQQVEEAYGDKVETAFVESVPEGQMPSVLCVRWQKAEQTLSLQQVLAICHQCLKLPKSFQM